MFVDFERAFDTINHTAIWQALQESGTPTKIINLVKELYNNSNCYVTHNNLRSDPIPVKSEVKQGCVFSPLLFNVVLDSVLRKVFNTARGLQWNLTERFEDLYYADDICLLAHNYNNMSSKLLRLENEAKKVGLYINIRKTKELRIGTNYTRPITIADQPIEQVTSFVYLGSIVDQQGGTEADVPERIKKAQRGYGMLTPV